MNLTTPLAVTLLFILLNPFLLAQQSITVPVTDFNPENLNQVDYENPRWSKLELPKRDNTNYRLIEIDDRVAIKAESINSASGLVYKVDIDPKEYPIIEWSWKVDEVIEKGDYKSKKGDDYPARIYITFDYSKKKLKFFDRVKYEAIRTFTSYKIPLRAINYIWANKAEEGTSAPNAYTDWVHMIAVETGENISGEWKIEIQNIYEDYKKAFGEEPPLINAVAIMTDSDDTKSKAEAYYGNIIFRKEVQSRD
ncbi:MAG: hypothetical protein BalsKO_06290 [Balneolaceae bacterium]